ncbi:MAG: cytochrome c oxidase subunit II [Actinobacteria bacterium]|nr:cytochrome c oxidase subunit II [Actinomycetota bacterium]
MRTPAGWRRSAFVALAGLLVIVGTACAPDAPQDYINYQKGPIAEEADRLWDVTFAIAVAIFFIVELLLIYTIVRFRARPDREAKQFHGNTKVEVILTVIPALILAGLAVPTVRTIFDLSSEPDDALQIKVTARQFWWEYEYEPEGTEDPLVTANEMHIPVDTPVFLTLEGDDVIHSFWVPLLAGKQDVVPGRTNHMTIEADEPGVYRGQCTEYCGLSHANMRLRVIAHPQDEFDEWRDDQSEAADDPRDALAAEGEELFLEGECINCHAVQGTDAQARTGPDLTHFASRETFAGAMFENTTENLRQWLDDPPAMKPGAKMPDYGLTTQEIDALVAYLQSLE